MKDKVLEVFERLDFMVVGKYISLPYENMEGLVEITKALKTVIKDRKASLENSKLSLCPKCYCMTKNICGKCKKVKEKI